MLPVFPSMLPAIWPHVAGMLDKSLPKQPLLCTIDDVRDMLDRGECNLWVAGRGKKIIAAFVTHLVVYPRARAIKAWLMSGEDMRDWAQPFFEKMTKHAKKNGCTVFEGCGRKGWTKIYPGLTDMGPAMLAMEIR